MVNYSEGSQSPVIINYKETYYKDIFELVNSKELEKLMLSYVSIIKKRNGKIARFLIGEKSKHQAASDFILCLKKILILEIDEIEDDYLKDKNLFLKTFEDIYTYFRSRLKFGVIELNNSVLTAKRFAKETPLGIKSLWKYINARLSPILAG